MIEPYVRDVGQATVVREARIHAALYLAITGVSVATGSWAAVIV
jgi:hypothetical protein